MCQLLTLVCCNVCRITARVACNAPVRSKAYHSYTAASLKAPSRAANKSDKFACITHNTMQSGTWQRDHQTFWCQNLTAEGPRRRDLLALYEVSRAFERRRGLRRQVFVDEHTTRGLLEFLTGREDRVPHPSGREAHDDRRGLRLSRWPTSLDPRPGRPPRLAAWRRWAALMSRSVTSTWSSFLQKSITTCWVSMWLGTTSSNASESDPSWRDADAASAYERTFRPWMMRLSFFEWASIISTRFLSKATSSDRPLFVKIRSPMRSFALIFSFSSAFIFVAINANLLSKHWASLSITFCLSKLDWWYNYWFKF